MQSCFLNLVLIVWQASTVLPCGGAQASNCSLAGSFSCDILKDGLQNPNQTICISTNGNSYRPFQNFTLETGSILTFRCTWTRSLRNNEFEWNLYVPEGWKVLLRVQSTRNLKVEAGDIYIDDTSGSEEDTNSNFDSVEDRYFNNTDHFLSKTNMIWIRASFFSDRRVRRSNSTYREVFDIITTTANITDSVDTKLMNCATVQMHSWGTQGYSGISTDSNGSFSIQCNQGLLQKKTLISFFYNISIESELRLRVNESGLIQFVYTGAKNLFRIMDFEPDLYVTYNFSQCDSFWIRFDASGKMELNIYNVTVQGLIYDDDVTTMTSNSTSNPLSSPSTYTTDEGQMSFTQENMTTWISETVTMTTEGMAADSLPIVLIATVSGVAIFLLVFLAVLCICLRKRCHKNQSRDRDSAPPNDPASFNNEHHEYCEVRPSVKSPPDKTASSVTDQSIGHKNYAFVVTGPAMVVADEETVHSGDKTAEVNTPTANNKVLSNGPVYTLVDMDKKALDREEKANNARNRGNAYVSNVDKLDFIPLDEYETVTVSPPVSPGASANLRPDSYPLSEYETVSPPMSPAAMAPELERPYDTLQRGPVSRKQTVTSSTVDKKVNEEADHDDALNVYNEIATPAVAQMESEEGSEAYQHLQRPLSKRPKAGVSLPDIPDEGYGRLDLEGSGASNQTDPVTHHAQDSQGPKTTQVDPMYAILEKPAKANVPDDDDPEYDLSDAFM